MATIVSSRQGAAAMQVGGTDRHDVVAVDDAAGVIDRQQAIGVAVERQPEIGAVGHDRRGERVEVGGTAVVVDVAPVRSVVDGSDTGGGSGEDARGECTGRSVGAVDDDA